MSGNENNRPPQKDGFDPVRERLYAYFLGDLTEDDKHEVERDVATSEELQETFALLRTRFRRILAHQAPLPRESSDKAIFAAARTVAAKNTDSSDRRFGKLLRLPFAARVAAALVLVAGVISAVAVLTQNDDGKAVTPESSALIAYYAADGSVAGSQPLEYGRVYTIAADTGAVVRFDDRAKLELMPWSRVRFTTPSESSKHRAELIQGEAIAHASEKSVMRVRAAQRTVEVGGNDKPGSAFLVHYQPEVVAELGEKRKAFWRMPLSEVLAYGSEHDVDVRLDPTTESVVDRLHVDFLPAKALDSRSYIEKLKEIGVTLKSSADGTYLEIDDIRDFPRDDERQRFAVVALDGRSLVLDGGSSDAAMLTTDDDAGTQVFGWRELSSSRDRQAIDRAEYLRPEGAYAIVNFDVIDKRTGESAWIKLDDGVNVHDHNGNIVTGGPGRLIQADGRSYFRDQRGVFTPLKDKQ